jgi:hypothetical protein
MTSALAYSPGTVMVGIERDGSLRVAFADDTIAVDLAQTNRDLAAEASRLRVRDLLDGQVDPLTETVDGDLVLDETHRYRLVRRERLHPHISIYERVR